MRKIFRRTSITVDEAVAILLGLSVGPIEYTPVNGTDVEVCGDVSFCLTEELEDEHEVLEGHYALAKHEKQPRSVINEKLEALQRHKEVMAQANAFLCALNDELNRGEHSLLKVDNAPKDQLYKYITLHSFNEWAKKLGKAILVDLPSLEPDPVAPPSTEFQTTAGPRMKMREQEQAILDEIARQGHDPKALPLSDPGKVGVKAAVRDALRDNPLFEKKTSFKRAWEQLREDKDIAERSSPSSLQKDR
jgi:hypothetical protein